MPKAKLYAGRWTKDEVEAKIEEKYGALDAGLFQKILKMLLTLLPALLPLFMEEKPLNAKQKKKLAAFEYLMGLDGK